ncbi:Uncharacterised protein g3060 [Pycnogonum litorale]
MEIIGCQFLWVTVLIIAGLAEKSSEINGTSMVEVQNLDNGPTNIADTVDGIVAFNQTADSNFIKPTNESVESVDGFVGNDTSNQTLSVRMMKETGSTVASLSTYQVKNSKTEVEDSKLDLESFYRRKYRCSADRYTEIDWSEMSSGLVAVKDCMKGYTGNAYRMCYYNGRWGKVDTSECRIKKLAKIRHLIYHHLKQNLTDGMHHLAFDMWRVLQSYPVLSIADVLEGMETTNYVLMNYDVVKRIKLSSPYGRQYYQLMMHIADLLISPRKQVDDESIQQMLAVKIQTYIEDLKIFGLLLSEQLSTTKPQEYTFNEAKTVGSKIVASLPYKEFQYKQRISGDDGNAYVHIRQKLSSEEAWTKMNRIIRTVDWFNGWGRHLADSTYTVHSDIVTVITVGLPSRLNVKNFITFRINKQVDSTYTMKCGYLKNKTTEKYFPFRTISRWNTDGCDVKHKNSTTITCYCSSNEIIVPIAVLLSQDDVQEELIVFRGLAVAVYGGCVISLIAVLLTFLSHICVERAQITGSVMIMLNLVVSVAATQVVFMTGIFATTNEEVCESVAIILHYLFMVTSFWLFSHTIHMYVMQKYKQDGIEQNDRHNGDFDNQQHQNTIRPPSLSSSNSRRHYIRYYCILAWLFPVTLIIMCYSLNAEGYETKRYCWMSIKRGMLLSYIVPIALLLAINTAMVLLAMRTFLERRPMMQKSDIDAYRRCIRGAVVMLPMVAVNWFMGVLCLEDISSSIMDYVFTFTNSLQGLLIYSFFASRNVESYSMFSKHNKRSRSKKKGTAKSRDRLRMKKSVFVNGDEHCLRTDAQPLLDISAASLSTTTTCDTIASTSTISESLCS